MKRNELKVGSFYTYSTKQRSYYDDNTGFMESSHEGRDLRGIGQLLGLRSRGLIRLTLFKRNGKQLVQSGYTEVQESEIISEVKAKDANLSSL